MRQEIRKIQELMEAAQYVTDAPVATSVHLAMTLRKPLLIEGHAGVGKTEVAKVMARMLETNLIRLQCYEGLDAATALYEWNYQKQLLHIKINEASPRPVGEREQEIFSEAFLLRRPLLQAISQTLKAPVLLVDEVDRCVTGRTLVATSNGVTHAEDVRPGHELVSFDPEMFRVARTRVKKVIPRAASSLVRLLVGGRFLEVTPDHKFVRYGDTGYQVVMARDLVIGDRLPLYKSMARLAVEEPAFEFPDNIVKLSQSNREQLHKAYKASARSYEELALAVGVSRNHLRNVIQPHPFRQSLRAGVLERLCSELDVPDSLDLDRARDGISITPCVALYELFGYIVADGCFTSDRLVIADKDRANLERYAVKFAEAFGAEPRIVPGPHENYELTYHSLPLGRWLARVLGRGMARSRERLVPSFVFARPREERAGFLRGYFDGEGWVGHHQIAATSASPYLLVGIQQLLSSLGVDSHISRAAAARATYGRGPYYTLSISDMRAFQAEVGFCAPAKISRAEQAASPRYTRTECLPRGPVVEALMHLCDTRVLGTVPGHQTVHDILARRVRPNVSSLRRVADAFDSRELRELVYGDVVLGEITSIETFSSTDTVYDFVLESSPYFVANQVVTHNCDEEFEAFMLEIFAEWQVTIPEIGTIKAAHPPHVILTSNRTRELSDALRRRCLYLWIDYPDFDKEVRIVERKVPGVNGRLAAEVARFMESLRRMRLAKVPGVAETLDWAQALASLHADHLDESLVAETLGCVLKDSDDMKRFRAEIGKTGLTPFLSVPG